MLHALGRIHSRTKGYLEEQSGPSRKTHSVRERLAHSTMECEVEKRKEMHRREHDRGNLEE